MGKKDYFVCADCLYCNREGTDEPYLWTCRKVDGYRHIISGKMLYEYCDFKNTYSEPCTDFERAT